METKGILVSFIGDRGSGKTTIATRMCDELDQRGLTCLRQHAGLTRRPFFSSLWTAIYLWRFFDIELVRALGFQGRTRRWWPSLYRFYLPLAFAHDIHQLATGHADVLVYDSNVLRGLMSSVARGEITPEFVADLYTRKVLPNVERLVFAVVVTEPHESVARWIARDNVRVTEAERAEAVAERVSAMRTAGLVLETLAKLPKITVVRLDGAAPLVVNSTELVQAITIS
ncbi:MAG: hypothetical protein WDZ93_00815 [Candidatus Paceibacterota bacterium]